MGKLPLLQLLFTLTGNREMVSGIILFLCDLIEK